MLRAGIGSLAEFGFAEAALWILAGNDRACKFYEGQGWRANSAVQTEEISGVLFREVRYRRDLP